MLLFDKRQIGNKLFLYRKREGLTQLEAAECAGISDRSYADIERGETNMRVGTLLKLCQAFHVTPDEILTEDEDETAPTPEELSELLERCPPAARETALKMMKIYLQSVRA